jgi:putative membrane protein
MHDVLAAVARIGVGGFVLFCLWFIGVFALLGAAWAAAAPDESRERLWLFGWARMVREACADLLPFSQIGGLVVGARTLIGHGVPARRVYGSMIVDMTTEMAAQLVFTLLGIVLFLLAIAGGAAAELRPLVLSGAGVMLAAMAGFFVAQRGGLGLAARMIGRVLPGSAAQVDEVRAELSRIYARRGHVAAAFAFNLAAWFGSAGGAWLGLSLMGIAVPFWAILMVESLIFTLRSVAFAIPGALGVQEVGYLLLAPIAGVAPEALLALSLIKRARDLALGLPTIIAWQLAEARAVTRSRPGGTVA